MRASPSGAISGPMSFSTAAATNSGAAAASNRVISPPMEVPTNTARAIPSALAQPIMSAT